jgi:hypothetical protein
MKKLTILAVAFALSGCLGNSASSNQLVGQVKKVEHNTPLIMPDYDDADISLGVMRNGVGSMSHEDIWVYIPNAEDYLVLQKAAETGALVKVDYDTARARFYVENATVTHAEITQ